MSSLEEKFEELKRKNRLQEEAEKVYDRKIKSRAPLTNTPLTTFLKRSDKLAHNYTIVEFLRYQVYHFVLVCFFVLYTLLRATQFVYRRSRLWIYYLTLNPSQSPQLIRQDVVKLNKLPRTISCILNLKYEQEECGGIAGLYKDVGELTAWTIGAGIPSLIIYEYNGVLEVRENLPKIINSINRSLSSYFGSASLPVFSIEVPGSENVFYSSSDASESDVVLRISLVSYHHGKDKIVLLTKFFSELSCKKTLKWADINVELVDQQLKVLSGAEPDLLVLFTPDLDLQGYPPWQIRLCEIYWEPDNDSSVNYVVFLKALQRFSTCKINVGK